MMFLKPPYLAHLPTIPVIPSYATLHHHHRHTSLIHTSPSDHNHDILNLPPSVFFICYFRPVNRCLKSVIILWTHSRTSLSCLFSLLPQISKTQSNYYLSVRCPLFTRFFSRSRFPFFYLLTLELYFIYYFIDSHSHHNTQYPPEHCLSQMPIFDRRIIFPLDDLHRTIPYL